MLGLSGVTREARCHRPLHGNVEAQGRGVGRGREV